MGRPMLLMYGMAISLRPGPMPGMSITKWLKSSMRSASGLNGSSPKQFMSLRRCSFHEPYGSDR